jgi:hypothetical protein
MDAMRLKAPFIVAAVLLAGITSPNALEPAKEPPAEDTVAAMPAAETPTPASDAFAGRLFAGKVAKDRVSYACFARKYDAARMAGHPKQKVTAMRLLVTAQEYEESPGLRYGFRVGVELRGTRGAYEATGDCSKPQASEISADKLKLRCGVDCDGGALTIELANSDKSTLLRIDNAIAISRDNGAADRSLAAGADDRVFRLDRTSIEDCGSLAADDEERADMRKP